MFSKKYCVKNSNKIVLKTFSVKNTKNIMYWKIQKKHNKIFSVKKYKNILSKNTQNLVFFTQDIVYF